MVQPLGNILWIWIFSNTDIRIHFFSLQLHADQPIWHRTSQLHTTKKNSSKTVLFPTLELFQLARNSDITKILRLLDTGKMCPITDIYKAYSEINVQWASVGSPVKMGNLALAQHRAVNNCLVSHNAAGHFLVLIVL